MKLFIAAAGLAALAIAPAAAQPSKVYPAEVFLNTTDFSLADPAGTVSADGERLLISSNETGVFNVYEVNAKSGERKALTDSTSNATFAVSYFPNDARYIYVADGGGDELHHVYVGGGEEPIDLTPGENLKAGFISWIDGGKAFVISTNERDQKFFDLYRVDAASLERTMLYQNDDGYSGMVVSRDGKRLAMIKARTSADNNIYLKDLTSDAPPQLITEHQGNISHELFDFTPDSAKLIFGADEHGEFVEAYAYDVAKGRSAPYLKADWDISYLTFSPSGRYRVYGVNDDATTRVTINDLKTGKVVKTPKGLPDGDIASARFFPGEKKIAFLLTASNAPANIYVADIGGNKFAALTNALNPAINPDDLAKSEVVRYPSYDALPIPAILTKPLGVSAENKAPAIVFVHGGPGGQSRTGYSAMVQHLVNHGYVVLAANNRGSSGYGKTFFHMDDKKHGDVDLRDIVAARHWLASQDYVDRDNIAVMGGSYGGYMTMAALAFHPEVFDAGVDIFGVTNWERTLTSIPPWWESFKEALYDEMGDPATDAERHRAISPLFHADNIVKPVLVVQGANDPRVLQVESDEMVAAIRANGVPVEYLLFPDEGHGFLKRENRIAASDAYVAFLDKYLKDAN